MGKISFNGRIRLALLTSACMVIPAQAQAQAQEQGAGTAPASSAAAAQPAGQAVSDPAGGADGSEVIVVTGARATQRSSIQAKRDSVLILDGVLNDEIGALPDNSVGDTLERITGVTADRFKGNANELSVRGLGPTLSFSTFNGREVSTAGPDRSVAFQQFPSELVNGVVVYKSQQASLAEGGVAGVIELRSLKPLDYGKRRIQGEIRGSYSPEDADIRGRKGFGYRANFSYVDQFDTGIGRIGISIGAQRQDQGAPEDYHNTNSVFTPCNTSANNSALVTGNAAALNAAGAGQNCSNATGPRVVSGVTIGETRGPVYYATSSRVFRQNTTEELRNALLGSLQWQPTPELDITFDAQYSKRESTENRNVLAIAEGLRGLQPVLIGDGTNGYSEGSLIVMRGNSNIENQLERRQRDEEYKGGGLSVAWTSDPLTISGDVSYSDSHRTETQKATRMRSSRRVAYTADYTDDVVPIVTFDNFDITDHDNFLTTPANSVYARNRFATDRRDRIYAGRLDLRYDVGGDFLDSLEFGGRYSEHRRTNDNARNNDLNTLVAVNGRTPTQLIADANANCRVPFPSSGYMSTTSTNVTSWASFDNDCLFRTFTGSDDALPYPVDGRDPSDIDVKERIAAAYVMANFETSWGDMPVRGNFGLRYVKTDITSVGFRLPFLITIDTAGDSYTVAADPSGTIETNVSKGKYQYWLPSANIGFDLSPKIKLRLAAYRAIARSGIEDFGAGIALNPTTGTGGVSDIVFNATTGNPNLKPLRAWNLDASFEYYMTPDTLLAGAVYYKWLTGAVIGRSEPRPTDITATTIIDDGTPVTQTFTISPVGPANDLETRHLYGLEVSASHAFSYLPAPLDGFGINGGYNLAFSNFEYPDTSPLADFVDPANIIGLSRHVASGSIYWEKYGLSLRAFYRYRSKYFKPNSGTNRYVRGAGYVNLSAQYDITKNVQIKLQALNVTNNKDVFYKGVNDSITEVSESGPSYYFGARFRF